MEATLDYNNDVDDDDDEKGILLQIHFKVKGTKQ